MLSRAVRVVTIVVLAELGVLVGLVGAFVHDTTAAVRGVSLPVGLLAALGAAVGSLLIARHAVPGRAGVLVAAGCWLVTAVVLSMPRPEGDLVIADGVAGYAFLWGGAILAAIVVTLPKSRPDHGE